MRVTAALDGLPGYYGARVDVRKGAVLVRYDPARLPLAALVAAVGSHPDYQVVGVGEPRRRRR